MPTIPQTRRGRAELRACDARQFLSDQIAKVRQGTVVALCLSETSIHAGKYRREDDTCADFARGPSIDLPKTQRSA